jgi:hypothetical protein
MLRTVAICSEKTLRTTVSLAGRNLQTCHMYGVQTVISQKKICARCGESWPSDKEFYRSNTDKNCIACKYEVKKAQHDRDPNRRRTKKA